MSSALISVLFAKYGSRSTATSRAARYAVSVAPMPRTTSGGLPLASIAVSLVRSYSTVFTVRPSACDAALASFGPNSPDCDITVTTPLAAEPVPVAAGVFVEDAGEQPTASAPPAALPATAPPSARNRRRDSPGFVVVMANLSIGCLWIEEPADRAGGGAGLVCQCFAVVFGAVAQLVPGGGDVPVVAGVGRHAEVDAVPLPRLQGSEDQPAGVVVGQPLAEVAAFGRGPTGQTEAQAGDRGAGAIGMGPSERFQHDLAQPVGTAGARVEPWIDRPVLRPVVLPRG